MKFKSDIEVQAGLKDNSDSSGASGQVLSSTVNGVSWISPDTFSSESSEKTHIPVKNTSGATIEKGTPVYITGETGNSGKIEIAPADASDSAKMPAVGILEVALTNNSEGFCISGGLLEGLATETIDGTTTTANDTVYVKSGGGLTMTKPTGDDLIQNVAKVARTHASNGSLVVSSILRTNDVPNLPTGRLFVGTDDNTSLASDVVFVDDANDRVGIGTTSPGAKLDVNGVTRVSGDFAGTGQDPLLEFYNTDASLGANQILGTIDFHQSDPSGGGAGVVSRIRSINDSSFKGEASLTFHTGEANVSFQERMRINSLGNVGIGTTSPSEKLEVAGKGLFTGTELKVENASDPSIQVSDTDVNYKGAMRWLSSNNVLEFYTRYGGTYYTSNLVLDRGNVGIGTTSPGAKLEVFGTGNSFRLDSAANGSKEILFRNVGTGTATIKTDGDLKLFVEDAGKNILFETTGGEKMRIEAGGNVGIGTTSPIGKLDVANDGLFLTSTNTSSRNWLVAANYLAFGDFALVQSDAFGSDPYPPANSTPRFYINSAGNVGIGTNGPGQKLTVNGDVGITTGNQLFVNDIASYTGAMTIGPTGASELKFRTSGNEKMRIEAGGNIGIGTTSPTRKLDVLGITKTVGFQNTNNYIEDFLYCNFNNGVADQNVDIQFGNESFWGYIEVEITGTFSNQNTSGKLTKLYAVGVNPATSSAAGIIYTNETRVSDSLGYIKDNIALGDLRFDGTDDTGVFAIRVSHIVSTGNGYTIKVRAFTHGSNGDNGAAGILTNLTLSPVYTQASLSRQYVHYNENVGIGTTSPGDKLNIHSSDASDNIGLKITRGTQTHGLRLGVNDSHAFLWTTEPQDIAFGTNDSQRVTIKSNGNVGIGTTNPNTNLEIGAAANVAPKLRLTLNDSGSSIGLGQEYGGIQWKGNDGQGDGVRADIRVFGEGSSGETYMTFGTMTSGTSASANAQPRMTISSIGNVGIGTISPTSLLEISQQLSAAAAIDYPCTISSRDDGNSINQVGGEGVGIKFRIAGNDAKTPGDSLVGASIAAIREVASDSDSSTGLGFFVTQNDETLDEALRIDHDGNVGIGTTSPGSKLTSNGRIESISIDVDHFRARYNSTYFTDYSTNGVRFNGSNQTYSFIQNGENRMSINSAGNVGIGTTSPAANLHVKEQSGSTSQIKMSAASNEANYGYLTMTDNTVNTAKLTFGTTYGYNTPVPAMTVWNGMIGIGTTSPSEKLEVDGNVQIGSTTDAKLYMVSTGGNGNNERFFIEGYADGGTYGGGFKLSTRNDVNVFNTAVTVNRNGNVGIGTTSPSNKLSLAGSGQNWSTSPAIKMWDSYNSKGWYVGSAHNHAIGDFYIRSVTGEGDFPVAADQQFTIKQSGNVGIGTISPGAKLEVLGNIILRQSASNSEVVYIATNARGGGTDDADLRLGNSNNGDVLTVHNANVGIGTTSPSYKLEVDGSFSGGGLVADPFTPSLNFVGMEVLYGGLSSGAVPAQATIGVVDSGIVSDFPSGEAIRINVYSDVGIGTTNPEYKLDVSGDIRAQGDIIAFSDARVKENVKTIPNALEKVSKLRGVEYNRIGESEKSIGVIAQEVEKIIPEVVKTDAEGMRSVAYGNMVGLLIEAINEQQKQIDKLKSKLDGTTN